MALLDVSLALAVSWPFLSLALQWLCKASGDSVARRVAGRLAALGVGDRGGCGKCWI